LDAATIAYRRKFRRKRPAKTAFARRHPLSARAMNGISKIAEPDLRSTVMLALAFPPPASVRRMRIPGPFGK
jgi:hypothetical protein